jgi:uncharacterized membrane protein YkvA (DUF1232 family)
LSLPLPKLIDVKLPEPVMFLRLGRLLRAGGRDLLVLWYACRNPGTPWWLKLAAVLLAVYLFSPLDLVPDWFVPLGWIDDVTLLALGIPALLRLIPGEVLCDARSAVDGLLLRVRGF